MNENDKTQSEKLAHFDLDKETEAHAALADLQTTHPRAECRVNWKGSGVIEIWSDSDRQETAEG